MISNMRDAWDRRISSEKLEKTIPIHNDTENL
jgi:hypothetical protein